MALYAIQLPDGQLVTAYIHQGETYDHHSLSAATSSDAPFIEESTTVTLQRWIDDALRGDTSTFDASWGTLPLAESKVVEIRIEIVEDKSHG